MSRNKVLATAQKELGTTENPPNSNKSKYGAWYGSGLDGQKWCAMFVSWVFNEAGVPLGHIQTKNGIHHCQSAHNYYKSKNMLTATPEPGDIIIYDWEGNGQADHIGIFNRWTGPDKTSLESYEGNTSQGNNSDGGKVMLRIRAKSLVKSFINPGVYRSASITAPDATLSVGSRSSEVTTIQRYLLNIGYAVEVDGWFGQQTEGFLRDFQKSNNMTVTGKADVVTVGALQEASNQRNIAKSKFISGSFLKKGSAGMLVGDVQRALNKKDAALKLNVSGIFDDATVKAVKAFQAKNKLTPDGIVGPQTFSKLGIA